MNFFSEIAIKRIDALAALKQDEVFGALWKQLSEKQMVFCFDWVLANKDVDESIWHARVNELPFDTTAECVIREILTAVLGDSSPESNQIG